MAVDEQTLADLITALAALVKRLAARQRSPMSPMDEQAYFEQPPTSTVYLPGAQPAQVAAAEPRRVALIFHVPDAAGTLGDINITLSKSLGLGFGFWTAQGQRPIELIYPDHPMLVQAAWYATAAPVGIHLTVFEVFLHKWPMSGQSVIGGSHVR